MSAESADVLIVAALGVESSAVTAQSGAKWRSELSATSDLPYRIATLNNGLSVALVQLPNMGPTSAAVTTTRAIEALRPKRVVVTGIAAGIGPDVALGDVLISDQVVDYDVGKINETGITHRWRGYQVDPVLLSVARARNVEFDLQVPDELKRGLPSHPARSSVHFGTILSGSKIIADGRTVSDLTETWTQAIGLEMEGGGGAAAAHNADPRPGFIIIKGVSDRANASKDDSYREYAAFLAASLTLQLLETGPVSTPEGSLRDTPPPPEPWQPVDDEALSGYAILDIKTMLKDCFNLAELRSLCSDIGLDWEDLANRDQKSLVIEEIVLACKRRFILRRLVARIRDLRPGAFT